MANKKIIMYVSIVLIVLILTGVGYYIINNVNSNKRELEYIPEKEITEKQLRTTLVTLYFLNPDENSLEQETRKIDSKDLLNYPYEVLINLLIEGPNNEKLVKLIPEKTKLIDTQIKEGILYINFSKEFIEEQNLGKKKEELIIKSIVNTITELTEINKVAILIEGEQDKSFPDNEIAFDKIFVRE